MSNFEMPKYHHPDFTQEMFVNAPDAKYEEAEKDGVVPEYYHSTSMYPEYFKINGEWKLAEESRMDSCVILCDDGHLAVVEARNIKKGDKVLLGRTERCEEGVYMHCHGFEEAGEKLDDQFVFRQGRSRETDWIRTGGNRRVFSLPLRGQSHRRAGAHRHRTVECGRGAGYQRHLSPAACPDESSGPSSASLPFGNYRGQLVLHRRGGGGAAQ